MAEARATLRSAMRPDLHRPRRYRIRDRGFAIAGLVTVAVVVAVIAIAATHHGTRPQGISAEGAARFPYYTATDVVSYADQVSLITAVSSVEHPDENVDPEQAKADGWAVLNNITFRVDRTLWHRDGAPALTGEFTTLSNGWWVRPDGSRQRFQVGGSAWVEVGDQFLAPLAFDNGKWSETSIYDTFPVKDGKVAPLDSQHTTIAGLLDGLEVDSAGQVFSAARPDPLAAKHFDLRPRERVHAVTLDRAAAARAKAASRTP
jgi:hypothetical protein